MMDIDNPTVYDGNEVEYLVECAHDMVDAWGSVKDGKPCSSEEFGAYCKLTDALLSFPKKNKATSYEIEHSIMGTYNLWKDGVCVGSFDEVREASMRLVEMIREEEKEDV